MATLPFASQITLYTLLALTGLFTLVLWGAQIWVLRGNAFPNPDGSKDDWHEQKIIYGIAFADTVLSCPATIAAIVLVFVSPRWGFLLLAMVSFWWVWANVMTTATSLRFYHPRISVAWFATFPLGALMGLANIAWIVWHFDAVLRS